MRIAILREFLYHAAYQSLIGRGSFASIVEKRPALCRALKN
jgi:hypothetical protein